MTTNLSEQIISGSSRFQVNDDGGPYVTMLYEAGDQYPRHYYLTEIKQLALRQMVATDRVRWHRSSVVVCYPEYFVLVVARCRVKAYTEWVKENILDGTRAYVG